MCLPACKPAADHLVKVVVVVEHHHEDTRIIVIKMPMRMRMLS